MSRTSSLTDLAEFAAKSTTKSARRANFWNAYRQASQTKPTKAIGHRVSDLLGVVLTLSARTRRMVAPKAMIELDVFSPNGQRAVRIRSGSGA